MSYENFYRDTFIRSVNLEEWPSKPPVALDSSLLTGWSIANLVMSGTNYTKLNNLDQIYIHQVGLFCNFADGLIPMVLDGRLILELAYSKVNNAFTGGPDVSQFTIFQLNQYYEVNRFLVGRSWFAVPANFNPITDSMYLLARISSPLGDLVYHHVWSTGSVNPDLANTGASLAGEAKLRFDVQVIASHSFEGVV